MSQSQIINAIKIAALDAGIKLSFSPETYSSTLKALNIDSLNAMSIIIDVEKALNVRLPDEDLASLKTLGDLIKAFEQQIKIKS